MYELIIPRSVEKDIKRLPCQLQKMIANKHLVAIQSSVLNNYHLGLLGIDDMPTWQEALKDYMISKGYIGSQDKAG